LTLFMRRYSSGDRSSIEDPLGRLGVL